MHSLHTPTCANGMYNCLAFEIMRKFISNIKYNFQNFQINRDRHCKVNDKNCGTTVIVIKYFRLIVILILGTQNNIFMKLGSFVHFQ